MDAIPGIKTWNCICFHMHFRKRIMNIPDPKNPHFARTNSQTVHQRAVLLQELLPHTTSIAEICCGDCQTQFTTYRERIGVSKFCGLDLSPQIVQLNRSRGIPCLHGNALDSVVLHQFMDFDVIFYGPPLSVGCDRHRLLSFQDVVPGYAVFARHLLGELNYSGVFVCICPRSTTSGDAQWLENQVRQIQPAYQLRLIHHSFSTVTGMGEITEPRLKYVELWFMQNPTTQWEIRYSGSASPSP
jgi:hypothetical protein